MQSVELKNFVPPQLGVMATHKHAKYAIGMPPRRIRRWITIIIFVTVSSTEEEKRGHPSLTPWLNRKYDHFLDPGPKKQILNKMIKQTTLRDGIPFGVKADERHPASRGMLFCLCEKTGSTAWKFLFLRMLRDQGRLQDPFRLNISPHKTRIKQLSFSENKQLLDDPKVPRIMLVRDPFKRLLSGFLDKAATHRRWLESRLPLPCHQNGGECYSPGEPFKKFVDITTHSARLNAHFDLLSNHCLIPDGLVYDYFLKVEDLEEWYPPLIALLQLERYAAKGWRTPTKFWPGQHDCFHANPPRITCDSVAKAIHAAAALNSSRSPSMLYAPLSARNGIAGAAPMATAWATAQTKSSRNKHADGKVEEFYSAFEVMAVTTWAKPDLDMFGYEALSTKKS